jgi:hypothetical protein
VWLASCRADLQVRRAPAGPKARTTYEGALRGRLRPMKISRVLTALFIAAPVAGAVPRAQTTGGTPFRIEKLDPALDDILAPDATLETLGDRFALTEAPVWVPDAREGPDGGHLLFSDNGRLFVEHGSDGMGVDRKGNLYTTSGGTPRRIQVTSPEGKPLGRLHLPPPDGEPRARVCATKVAFGDADDRGLYITSSCTHLFKIRMKTPGVRPGKKN